MGNQDVELKAAVTKPVKRFAQGREVDFADSSTISIQTFPVVFYTQFLAEWGMSTFDEL